MIPDQNNDIEIVTQKLLDRFLLCETPEKFEQLVYNLDMCNEDVALKEMRYQAMTNALIDVTKTKLIENDIDFAWMALKSFPSENDEEETLAETIADKFLAEDRLIKVEQMEAHYNNCTVNNNYTNLISKLGNQVETARDKAVKQDFDTLLTFQENDIGSLAASIQQHAKRTFSSHPKGH